MENELKKLAAAMRDMSDMVGDHHWRAAKAIEELNALKSKKAELGERGEPKTFIYPGNQAVKNAIEVLKRPERIAELEADLAQRDAEIEGLNAELDHVRSGRSELQSRVNALESQQSASVGGEREAPKVVGYLLEKGNGMLSRMNAGDNDFPLMTVAQHERIVAALSPAGGGVVMPERQKVDHIWPLFDRGWNACLDEFARLNAKPQANSQEGE